MTHKMRGRMTEQIEAKAHELLGVTLTQTELRLMPYIQHVMMNEQNLDPRKINAEERAILADWRSRGWIEGGAAGLSITKEFWDAINEILWIGYVCGEAKDFENAVEEIINNKEAHRG